MKNIVLFFSFLPLIVLSACSGSKPPRQPNILFIMTDDHGYQAVSSYSDELINTPNLDRIASEGVLFTNSFVSNSICAPSRAVMLTGKHSHLNGQLDNGTEFDGSQQTFPKLLQQAGYQTAIVGKWHLRSQPEGFDYWNILPGQGSYYNPDFIEMGEQKRIEGYVTDLTTDIALKWLDEGRDPDRPFCLLLHHKAPHRTWQPDTALLDDYAGRSFRVPGNYFDDYAGREAAAAQKMSVRTGDMDLVYDLKMNDPEAEIETRFNFRMDHTSRMNIQQKEAWDRHFLPLIRDFKEAKLTGKELDLWKLQRYLRDYLACIESVDNNVGRVLDYLKKNDLDKNTVIVYTSDQGFYLGEHGWFDKRFMYEESMRTPLMMRFPESYHINRTENGLVQNIDFAPTFLDLAGVDIPADIQGKSLLPLLQDSEEQASWREALYYHYYEYPNEHAVKRHYGIRTDRYKLIHFYYDIDSWELYDLENDPHEMNNIYGDASYKDLVADLRSQLEELRIKYRVPDDKQ
ncbi:MAG: sulfatase [Marinilabiliaceae bacterium]|jgi:arylsulfatase A-like enzyme|nr:sulfatase [Marinilabiliaceae bacterium]